MGDGLVAPTEKGQGIRETILGRGMVRLESDRRLIKNERLAVSSQIGQRVRLFHELLAPLAGAASCARSPPFRPYLSPMMNLIDLVVVVVATAILLGAGYIAFRMSSQPLRYAGR